MIQPLYKTDLPAIKALLNFFELPVSDVEIAPIQFFGVKKNNTLITVGAIEIYGTDAILRSVAVHRDYQKMGYGKIITRYLEKKAVELGIKKLYLLTTTAESFFRRLDYTSFPRELCPDKIKKSAQFTDICPASAICMFKNLMA